MSSYIGFIITSYIYLIVKNKFNAKQLDINFSRLGFIYTLKKDFVYIIYRAMILSYPTSLLFMIIFRLPAFISLDMGWSHLIINRVILGISIFGFIGASISRYIVQYIKPRNLLYFIHASGIFINLVWIISGRVIVDYVWWILLSSFIYGALIYLNPIFLYNVADFQRHNRLHGRYLGYFLAYSLIGGIVIFTLDLSHYLLQSYFMNTSLYILIITAVCGIVGLRFYSKHFHSFI